MPSINLVACASQGKANPAAATDCDSFIVALRSSCSAALGKVGQKSRMTETDQREQEGLGFRADSLEKEERLEGDQ
jgi:hypothetical protein